GDLHPGAATPSPYRSHWRFAGRVPSDASGARPRSSRVRIHPHCTSLLTLISTMAYQSHQHYMERAYQLAAKGYAEGGCPIGGVLVDNETGEILGEGLNALVQEGDPIVHGEMAALRAAGRLLNRHHTTMYTTLQPCFMCTGAITQFGIPRVVVADVTN